MSDITNTDDVESAVYRMVSAMLREAWGAPPAKKPVLTVIQGYGPKKSVTAERAVEDPPDWRCTQR